MRKLFLFLSAICLSLSVSARVAYLVPGNTNDKGQIPLQWYPNEAEKEVYSFERRAYDWFKTTYADAGIGDFINFTNIPTNADKYAAIWIYVDRELSDGDFRADKFDALFTDAIVGQLKTYVQNGGNLFLGKQASRLAWRIDRIGYAPEYGWDNFANEDDRYWGIKAKLGSALAVANQRDRSSHPIYDGLTTATLDGVEGCFPLLDVTDDSRSTNANCHWVEYWTPNGAGGWHKNPDNNGDPALIDGWESYWNARALGTWTGIGDYCYIQAVEFMPKDAFKGTVLTINIAAYQWNGRTKTAARENVEKLTKNALRYLNRPSRADLRIDNAFKTCGRVDCGSEDDLYNAFMILHPVVEGLNAQPYTTSFEGIEEANRAVVEEWQDGETKRLAFTKAGQVKLQINLRESRTDHFWPAGDYSYEQLLDFAFNNSDAQAVADADLSSNGLQGEDGKFMLLHPNMRGLDSLEYAISFDGIEEAQRAKVVKIHDGGATRLGFTKAGTVKLNIRLNEPNYTTEWAKGEHNATKTVIFAQPTFDWTHKPDVAAPGEDKDPVAATCTNVPGITAVHYESDDTDIATVDAETGKITYNEEGTCNVYAYILINGVKFSSEAQKVTVTGMNIQWTTEPKAETIVGNTMPIAAAPEYGVAEVEFETTNCTYSDGALHFNAVGTATVRPYAVVGGTRYDGEQKSIEVKTNVYTRTIMDGYYGTLCLGYDVPEGNIEGATMYEVACKMEDNTGIYLTKVTRLDKDHPYLFLATSNELRLTFTGEKSTILDINYNGLHGVLNNDGIIDGKYTVPKDKNHYILGYNEFLLVNSDNVTVSIGRAFLKGNEIPEYKTPQAGAPARVAVRVPLQENVTTGNENVNENENIKKVLINGQIYIVREGRMFDITGKCL